MRTWFMVLGFLVLAHGVARAEAPPPPAAPPPPPVARAECFQQLSQHTWERGAEAPTGAGQRFLDALKTCDDLLHAAVTEAARYQVQDREAKVFVRQRKFVIAAYAVLWVILIGFATATYLRQGKLSGHIRELEQRLARHEAQAK